MPVPINPADVENAVRPWLGTLFLRNTAFLMELTDMLRSFAPYRQTLEDMRSEVERFLIRSISRCTGGRMVVLHDNFQTEQLNAEKIYWLTDDVMGVLFDKLTPFSANFLKLNDFSLRVQSLSALRVLYQRYNSFYTPNQLDAIKRFIKRTYEEDKYKSWLIE